MLRSSTLQFLSSLEKNNNKPWFEQHRNNYEEAKTDFHDFVEKLIPAFAAFDPNIAQLQAKNCTFRINRDIRFSKNKTPYKNNLAAYFNEAGKKGNGAGYYLHIQPGKSFAAAGIWMPEAAGLSKIRQEIDYNLDDLKMILKQPSFKTYFKDGFAAANMLARPPKGYNDDNPAIAYLKLKSFEIIKPISDAAITNQAFLKDVIKIFRAAHPLVAFLNKALA